MSLAVESPQRQATKAWAASWIPREMIRNPRLRAPTISVWLSEMARKMAGSGAREGSLCGNFANRRAL